MVSVEEVQEGEDLVEDGKFNVLFSKGVIDSGPDLLEHDSIKELMNYIDNKDAKIEKVKVLVKRANRELRLRGKKLYVRRAHCHDRYAENRICMTSR